MYQNIFFVVNLVSAANVVLRQRTSGIGHLAGATYEHLICPVIAQAVQKPMIYEHPTFDSDLPELWRKPRYEHLQRNSPRAADHDGLPYVPGHFQPALLDAGHEGAKEENRHVRLSPTELSAIRCVGVSKRCLIGLS